MNMPIVVYHVAAMGNWKEVVIEQLKLLKESGLDNIRYTHVGDGADWLASTFKDCGLHSVLVRSDPNIMHYETFAMLEIERLAKAELVDRPILYFHTKGVSNSGHAGKRAWRRTMDENTVRQWKQNVVYLNEGYDAVGVCWTKSGEQHFSGNFWIASPDWIRRLPDYVAYHHSKQCVRYSCELWIGALQWCRAYSLVCSDQPLWEWDSARFPDIPKEIVAQETCLNLGCGSFKFAGWVNADVVRTDTIDPDILIKPGPLPFANDTFDRAYLGHILEHVPWSDVADLLREVRRVVKPEGTVTIVGPDTNRAIERYRTDPTAESLVNLWGILEDGKHHQANEPNIDWVAARHHWNPYPERVVGAMTAAGFKNVREIFFDATHLRDWPVVSYDNTSQCAVSGIS